MAVFSVYLVLLICGGAVAVALQIYLSLRRSRWPGLALPAINVLWALAMFAGGFDVSFGFMMLLKCLIPCVVLATIYLVCRERVRERERREIDRMNAQDL